MYAPAVRRHSGGVALPGRPFCLAGKKRADACAWMTAEQGSGLRVVQVGLDPAVADVDVGSVEASRAEIAELVASRWLHDSMR